MPIENTSTENNDNTNNVDAGSAEVKLDLSETSVDDVFEKHIDIAIEAQDGKAALESGTDGEAAPKEGDKGQAKAGADSIGSGKDNTAQSKSAEAGKKDEAGTRGPKDLTLGDGTVIKGGPERRFYEQAQIAKQRATHLETQLTTAQTELATAKMRVQEIEASVQAVNGIPPQELAIAANIYRDLKSNPVGAVQKLLAELAAKGYKIEGHQPAYDIDAIKAAVRAELGASLQTHQGPTEAEIVAEAQREATQFFGTYPDAKMHETLIARVMHDHPGVDLYTAYFRLKESFAQRDFDWTRPLEEQLQERTAAGASAEQQQQNNQQQQVPLPGSRPATPPASDANKVAIAHESTSMDDIIRESMRDAGMQV